MSTESPKDDVVSLISEIDFQLKHVHTQSLDLSFNELADMIEQNELDISPDYQRLFLWSEGSRSRFIESLLLEMPVPPIYVIEEEDNKMLLIDGLQRISSYLHFRGLLKAEHLKPEVKKGEKLILQDCDIVKSLNGKTYDDLGVALQIKLKRSFVRVEVVRKGSNSKFKYHMFKRLNTGGEALTNQQLRNCTIRLLDPRFNDFINSLAKDSEDYKTCISTISDDQFNGAYDRELILRFFALKNWKENFKHDVADFLTEYMEAVSDPDNPEEFDYDKEKGVFLKTFEILAKSLNHKAFGRWDNGKIIRGFGIYHFEAFTIGIQPHLQKIDISKTGEPARIEKILTDIKSDNEFIKLTTGGGKNSPGPLADRINFVKNVLDQQI